MSDTSLSLDGPTAGTLLRRARESAGLHVATLAVSLKVPVRKLEALEDDRFDLLPDAVFARALAATVCRTLKIDPQAVLDRLPQSAAPRLVPQRGSINAPFRAPGDAVGPTWRDQLTKPVSVTVGSLLLGALVLLLWPLFQRSPAPPAPAAVAAAPGAAPAAESAGVVAPQAAVQIVPMVPEGTAARPEASSTALVKAPSGAAEARAPAAGAAPTTPSGTAVASVPAAAAAPAAATMPPSAVPAGSVDAPPASGMVVFRATAPSWVQVIDAKGAVSLRRLLAAGESAGASGTLPLAVTVGSAATTEVQVRGKPFDLARVARDNVARFEVK